MENWKEYNGYRVSDRGVVVNSKGHVMKPQYDKDGYVDVTLTINGKRKKWRIHRLVATLFLPNPDNLPTINHINEIKDDNRLENLEWMTIKDNVTYSQSDKVAQYTKDGKLIKVYASIREAERETHTGHKEIGYCCKHKIGYKSAGGFKWEYYNN